MCETTPLINYFSNDLTLTKESSESRFARTRGRNVGIRGFWRISACAAILTRIREARIAVFGNRLSSQNVIASKDRIQIRRRTYGRTIGEAAGTGIYAESLGGEVVAACREWSIGAGELTNTESRRTRSNQPCTRNTTDLVKAATHSVIKYQKSHLIHLIACISCDNMRASS